MINRLVLSLRKAAGPSEAEWFFMNTSRAPKHDLEFAQIADEETLLSTEEDVSLAIVPPTIPVSVTRNIQIAGDVLSYPSIIGPFLRTREE